MNSVTAFLLANYVFSLVLGAFVIFNLSMLRKSAKMAVIGSSDGKNQGRAASDTR